jgi:hypothetical protein
MKQVTLNESAVMDAVKEGMDEFLKVFTDACYKAIDGELTAENMKELNSNQIALIAYDIMRNEVMNGGFVQLIHNGYGGFIFLNPFAKLMRLWGLKDLQNLIYSGRQLYEKYHQQIEKDCTDDEFMEMFEHFDEFDDLDDEFVENEEEYTESIARYIDGHLEEFAEITKN